MNDRSAGRDFVTLAAERRAPGGRTRAFLLLRFTLIIATGYLVMAQKGPDRLPAALVLLLGLALVSNLVLPRLPRERLESPAFMAAVIVGDTLWVTVALVLSGTFTADFFYLYFFVLFLAGIGENLRLIALGAVVVSAAYVVVIAASGDGTGLPTMAWLVRIPFLFAVAIFYGYLVDRLRTEQRTVAAEARVIARLEDEIAERRRVEVELVKYSWAVHQSSNLMVLARRDGTIEYANPSCAETTGRPVDELVGSGLAVLGELGVEDGALNGILEAAQSGQEWQGVVSFASPQGRASWCSLALSPVRGAGAEVTHLLVVATDISDRIEAEGLLRRANEELHRVVDMKSNLVSVVTHELKNPLTVIRSAVGILQQEADDDSPTARFTDMIRRAADRMVLLIDDLLELSKAESGQLRIQAEAVDLATLLPSVVGAWEAQAREAGVALEVDPESGSASVLGDPQRLEQVLSNLVSNALKATSSGDRIRVGARAVGHRVDVWVADTGVGLDPADQERVFEAFAQAGTSERRQGGTGLGLTICRDLVHAHGGELRVDSRPGHGSRFVFDLPAYSERMVEEVAFENAVCKFREHPYFTVLVARPVPDAAADFDPRSRQLEWLSGRMRELLPRATDVLTVQRAHRRILLVLLGTSREGACIVRDRLERAMSGRSLEEGLRATIHGPSVYPEDGRSGVDLVERALHAQSAPAEEE